jgi:chemotaxis protein methyltransferase CheR
VQNVPPHVPALPGTRTGPQDRVLVRAFQHLVEERLGLYFPKEREEEFLEGLARTSQALNFSDLPDLFQRLEAEAPAGPGWRRLGMELTTGESFFFRDRGQMALIRDVLLEELKRRARPGEPLCLWSAGCSRGEEAYSLAILAHDVLQDHSVRILGTDINPWALETAREGWYTPWSLRGVEPALRGRWFLPEGDGFRVIPELRQRVSFREHNLLRDPMWILSEGQGFDLILCRNVFIYFLPRRAQEAIQAFRRSLKPKGALVLGHGEWGLERPEGMSLEMHPHSTVLRPEFTPSPSPSVQPPQAPSVHPPPQPQGAASRPAPPKPAPRPRSLEERLREIRSLADTGQLDAALALGQGVLRDHPLSAQAHHLLSMILAEGRELEASLAMLDRALYLDPHLMAAHLDRARHFESLGAFSRAARAWAAARKAAESLPEDTPLEELGASSREELKAFLEEAMHRCEERTGDQSA